MPGMLRKSTAFVPRYQKFESISLQRGVCCEPAPLYQGAINPDLRWPEKVGRFAKLAGEPDDLCDIHTLGVRCQVADLPGRRTMSAYGFSIGLGSSLMGISGGSPATLVLTLYGKPIHKAVATSAGIGVPITIAGTIGYIAAGLPHQALLPPMSLGFVSLIGVAVIAPISSWAAPWGARLAHAPRRWLEIGFGAFLLLVAVRFVASLA
jgi:uncharacterized membrane protein YfcA